MPCLPHAVICFCSLEQIMKCEADIQPHRCCEETVTWVESIRLVEWNLPYYIYGLGTPF